MEKIAFWGPDRCLAHGGSIVGKACCISGSSFLKSLKHVSSWSGFSDRRFSSRVKLVKVSNDLKSNRQPRAPNSRRKKTTLPGAVITSPDAIETAKDDGLRLQNAVAALEEAYKQDSPDDASKRSSRGNTSEFDDKFKGLIGIKRRPSYPGMIIRSTRSKRLSLRNRVTLKRIELGRMISSRRVVKSSGKIAVAAPDDIWSAEAEDLIRSSFDLKVVDWHNLLHHDFLSSQEEIRLCELIKPIKHLQYIRSELRRVWKREPSDDDWAKAANMDLRTLRRRLQLGQAAQNKLIQHNTRLVLSLARKYERDAGSFSLEDLCQEGVKGLIDAMDHFNPGKGARFSTYAIFWIRTGIMRAITRTGHILRLPFSFATKNMEIKKARRELRMELARDPSDEEIMERVGLDANQYWNVRHSKFKVRSLNQTIKGTGEELMEYLPERGDIVSDSAEILQELETVLARLKPKEKMVLKHRYGLEDGHGVHSLREVGRRLNMSREMVRKYEARGLQELKQPEHLGHLRLCLSPV